LASGEASFIVATIAPAVVIPAVVVLVAVNRRISSIRLDDDSGRFRGCFISHPQKFSYIDRKFEEKGIHKRKRKKEKGATQKQKTKIRFSWPPSSTTMEIKEGTCRETKENKRKRERGGQ
jgi:hypothetical protein